MKYLLTLFLSFFISLFFVGSVVTAPSYVYQKSIYPLTDNTYTLGTTTLNWMNIYTKQLCLNGDCKTSWPTGGSGSGTTTLNNTFVGFGNSDNTVTGTPTFTFNTTTQVLSIRNVSSTSVTTTNLYTSGLTFTNASGTSITSTNIFSNGKTDFTSTTFRATTSDGSTNGLAILDSAGNIVSRVNSDGDIIGNLTGSSVILGGLSVDRQYAGLWLGQTSPNATNYMLLGYSQQTFINAPNSGVADIEFRIGNGTVASVGALGLAVGLAGDTTPSYPLQVKTTPSDFVIFNTGLVSINTTTAATSSLYFDASTTPRGGIFFGETGLYRSSTGTLTISSNLSLSGLTFGTATGTSVSTTNLYIAGALTQVSFGDCANAVTSKVLYTASTGLFSCGTDQNSGGSPSLTNTNVAFGDENNLITSSTNFTFTTSTNLLQVIGTVSSTNALFNNATTTNLYVAGNGTQSMFKGTGNITFALTGGGLLNFNGTQFYPGSANTVDLGITSGEFKDGRFLGTLFSTGVSSTKVTSTNALFINVTTTNLFATSLSFTNLTATNITTTNMWASSLLRALTVTSTNFTSVNATSTNFWASTQLRSPIVTSTNFTSINVTSTNIWASTLLRALTATSTNFTAVNATSTNLAYTGRFTASDGSKAKSNYREWSKSVYGANTNDTFTIGIPITTSTIKACGFMLVCEGTCTASVGATLDIRTGINRYASSTMQALYASTTIQVTSTSTLQTFCPSGGAPNGGSCTNSTNFNNAVVSSTNFIFGRVIAVSSTPTITIESVCWADQQ